MNWWSRTKNQRFFSSQTVRECGRWIFFGISFFWAWNLNHLSHPLMPFDAENDFSEKKIARFFVWKSQKTVSRVKKNWRGVKNFDQKPKKCTIEVDLKISYMSRFSASLFISKILLSSKKAVVWWDAKISYFLFYPKIHNSPQKNSEKKRN